jgi:AbiV family abortive infection protein
VRRKSMDVPGTIHMCHLKRPTPSSSPRRAAIQNAVDLQADAELLADRGRWPRTYALAVLAMEEIGKALTYVAAFLNPTMSPEELDKDVRSHTAKLVGTQAVLVMLGPDQDAPRIRDAVERAASLAHSSHDVKLCSLYVDLADDGTCRMPSEITEHEARQVVADLRSLTPILRHWLTDEAATKLNELADIHADQLRDVVGIVVQLNEVDPDTLARMVRNLWQGELPAEVAEELAQLEAANESAITGEQATT